MSDYKTDSSFRFKFKFKFAFVYSYTNLKLLFDIEIQKIEYLRGHHCRDLMVKTLAFLLVEIIYTIIFSSTMLNSLQLTLAQYMLYVHVIKYAVNLFPAEYTADKIEIRI